MKKIILLLVTGFFCINLYSQINNELVEYKPYIPRYQRSNVLDNGTYEAIVEYRNYSTQTFSKYSLTVVVVNDRVIQINFGNGGYISFSSPNIYSYSGGQLSFTTDYSGSITGAFTTVTVQETYTNSVTYKIYL